MLADSDFPAFFRELHGVEPFPWQERLLSEIVEAGSWPSALDLPTGSGKTSVIDIALFHLALEFERGKARRAPLRIAFVVDRRLVVDDAFERAQRIARRLMESHADSVAHEVARRLVAISGTSVPLEVARLRGGIPRESDWVRNPSQPTVLCSTIDQIGSRLLFRGYGVSNRMKPIHAGLIGADCLILLDEAHLARPFRQTLAWIRTYQGEAWRDADRAHAASIGVALLSATPEKEGEPATKDTRPFRLAQPDFENEVLKRRLSAPKLCRLVVVGRGTKKRDEGFASDSSDDATLVREAVAGVIRGIAEIRQNGIDNPALGVVMNRVARARAVFEALRQALASEDVNCILMIGPSRPVDRSEVVRLMDPVRSRSVSEPRRLEKALVLVATQCIEVGVDIDLDGLITEAASLSALRQRFGRVNRMGRGVEPFGLILAAPHTLRPNHHDPVYGGAIAASWEYLQQASSKLGGGEAECVDFGITALARILEESPPSSHTEPKIEDAPVLLPAHVDLLSQTSPIPSADPEVGLYLHGAGRALDSIVLLWRADIHSPQQDSDQVRRLLLLMPPRSGETIELPLWSVRRWLAQDPQALDALADVAGQEPDSEIASMGSRQVYRWCGDDDRSRWVTPEEVRPGDTIIVPAIHGGIDQFGWHPVSASQAATDVAEAAAAPFEGSRFTVRVVPELMDSAVSADSLAEALSGAVSLRWDHLRDAVMTLQLPEAVRRRLDALNRARGKQAVRAHLDLYGTDAEDRPRGVVFSAAFGLKDGRVEDRAQLPSTEDDAAGSLAGYSLSLAQHSKDVQAVARDFATRAGLPEDRIEDLSLAGYLHDAGKADPRFQSWLHYDDPLGPDLDDPEQILAKSRKNVPSAARQGSKLPAAWRHEALSVRLALAASQLGRARDPELVVWLIGTHHGYGRPFFPHDDPADRESRRLPPVLDLPSELAAGFGPQSLAFECNGTDWSGLFGRLASRYGVWALAHMEAILRLADHRASAAAENRVLIAQEER
jgi:CRISPR-associated endonuclease/helicase Cas3